MKPSAGCLVGLGLVWVAVANAGAEQLSLPSGTHWRAIGPVGNLEGTPIANAGLFWESVNVGWNTDLSYDDSDAAGWKYATKSPYPAANAIWADGMHPNGFTPAYFRYKFVVDGTPTKGLLTVLVDDDAQVYINGERVVNDTDGVGTLVRDVDVTTSLRQGENLIATKAHDSWGGGEHFMSDFTIQYEPIPEPSNLVLLSMGAVGLLVYAWRRRKIAN